MLLAIDVGNTNIVAALCDSGRVHDLIRFETSDKRAGTFLSAYKNIPVEGIIISSVVPKLDGAIRSDIRRVYGAEPIFVSSDIFKGIMDISLPARAEIGADRLVNAYAARIIYGKPAIIIDFGTATTFCAVNAKGAYIGGAIAPGIGISRDALHEKTAKLPLVELKYPKSVIGQDTVSAMQSGILYGYVGIVEGLVGRLKKVLGRGTRVIATGGLAGKISSKTDIIEVVDPDLTLKGLELLWKKIWKI